MSKNNIQKKIKNMVNAHWGANVLILKKEEKKNRERLENPGQRPGRADEAREKASLNDEVEIAQLITK